MIMAPTTPAGESASLAILDRIEQLTAEGTARLQRQTFDYGNPREGLVNASGELVALFGAGVSKDTAEAAALLITHAHVLVSLGRLGLAGTVVMPPRPPIRPLRRELRLVP